MVAWCFIQAYLIDYDETFAPVARILECFILSIENQFNLKVNHMDVKTAFLNGILKDEIFMKTPEGSPYENGNAAQIMVWNKRRDAGSRHLKMF